MTIASIFARYYDKHGQHLKSFDSVQRNLGFWLAFHKEATLAEAADLRQQEAFREWLQAEKKLSLSSVRKAITIGKSAFNWAYKRGEILQVPYFEMVTPPPPEPKGRHLEVSEIAALIKAANHDHVKMFLLLLIGTAARPQAVLDLTFQQIDFERNIIDLNPAARTQARNKTRPVVKLPQALKSILLDRRGNNECTHVINYLDQPVKSAKTSWGKLRQEAGLDTKVVPYSIRRTMARFMRMQGVSSWQLSEQLGHRGNNGLRVTELYTSHSPDYLLDAVAAIDVFFGQLACELRVNNLSEIFT